MKTARQLVAGALIRMERDGSWSNLTLDALIGKNSLEPRDAAFAGALFYGALERLITLDACIAAHSRQSVKSLSPAVRAILRMTVYQLLYMDSIPDYAAVGEAVDLSRKMRAHRAAGFINAVLRAFISSGKRIPLPKSPEEKRLSVEYSVCEELARLWLDSYGTEKTEAVLKASFGRPPVYIRANTLKISSEELLVALRDSGMVAEMEPDILDCIAISGQSSLSELPAYKQGLFHVQDKSAQLCCLALDVKPGQRVLDTCAAPGGKSFTIAQLMEGKGEIISAELHGKRAEQMAVRAIPMWINNMRTLHADMTVPHTGLGLFDRVICDVPCSGYGVIRRKPEIRYKPPSGFAELTQTQYGLLSEASKYCSPGARLIYSTCTMNPAENEDIAARFLKENLAFSPAPLPDILGGESEVTLTGENGGDCFYIAAFERVGM